MITIAIAILTFATPLVVTMRFGLLSSFLTLYVSAILSGGVTGFSGWHSYTVWIPLLVTTAIAVGAFYVSLAGRPIFREALMET